MSKYVTDEMVEKGTAEARAWGVKSSHGVWYSGDDGELCPGCLTDLMKNQ